ncbi:MAG: hypothetical protein HGA80_09285 [Candidatus Omnitrophica bacterium]|nr:hypothetical protein [Candidatus Omnitrophota bacterium]
MFKKILIVLFGLSLALVLYWAKCQLGLNLIKGFAWEKPFPFLNTLQKRESELHPRPGTVLLRSSFDELFPSLPWGELWARENGLVVDRLERSGLRRSRCLVVNSFSRRDWAIGQGRRIEVFPGEEFSFSGYARTTGEAVAQLSVVTHDGDRKTVEWHFALQEARGPNWRRLESRFTVPEGVRFLRFRLTGAGIGEAYFDDIRFAREK